ncbi:uncharacterized protein LOC141627956 [Silene latifolia]|uniref:uncharacterized protein LOC141627956 n=1 Tax=Silene latifolia TaxID=37657 RepID=UPI003D77CE9B
MGANPPWEAMEGYLHRIWQNYEISSVSFLPNGLFVVRFAKEEHKRLVLEQGMFFFYGKPIILRSWETNVKITKVSVKTVPIWMKLVGLDLKFWGAKCLEKLASLVGKFVRVDDCTLDKLLLGYAKVMVEVEVDQHFPDRIHFDDENGQEVTVLHEYDWLPITCQKCKGIGHSNNMCRGRAKVFRKSANGPTIPAPKQVWRKKPDVVVNLDPKEYPVLKSPWQGGGGPGNSSEGLITPTNIPANIPQVSMFTPARILTRMTRHESRIPGGKEGDFVTSINAELTKSAEMVIKGRGGVLYPSCLNLIEERVPLWNALKSLSINEPWVVLGDFNNVKYSSESVGKPVKDAERIPFQEVLDECELHDMKTTGTFFTWTNKKPSETRVFSKIDRVVVNIAWLDVWPDYFAHFAPEGSFDHCPCAISCEDDNIPRRKTFKVVQKLKLLKPELKPLNRNLFSDVERNAEIAYTILLEYQRNLKANPRDLSLMDIEYQAKESYLLLAQARDDYLRQKSKCQWAKDGDTNSAMFHKVIKSRQIQNKVLRVEDHKGGHLLGSNAATTGFYPHIVEKGPKVRNADWDALVPSPDEIKQVVFSITDDKSPGPDGYTSYFFKTSWSIIQSDICKAIRGFFLSGQMLKQQNNTNLVFLPKTENPISVKEFRPIACCNTLYKVISKLLCNRLAAIPPNLINHSQDAFIKGRSIMGNILISQDLWFMNCITTTSYSIVLNGQSHGFLPGKRGLRQGDPISPLLFTLCMEYLSRLLKAAYEYPGFKYHPLCKSLKLSHLMFADDLLLFCRGDIKSVMTFMEAFNCFSGASGLQISSEKSDIILNGLTPSTEDNILKYTGFKKGTLPFKYLGVQISHKRLTKLDCNVLVDWMLLRIRGWNKRKISYSGRLVLVKSVLATIHNYWSQIFILPMGVIDRIKALCRNFLWEGGEGYSKALLVAWCTLCKGKGGGLGLIDTK